MTKRPAPVRITDYRDPQFDPVTAEIRDALAPVAESLELSARAIGEQARSELSLNEFGGDGSWAERLDVLCGALRDEGGLSPFGVVSNHTMLLGMAKSRLLLEDLLRRHPEIHDIEIAAPIIICGLPRTGTTHLHNLMSADSGLRSLPYWESLEPIPNPGDTELVAGEDPRITRCKQSCEFLDVSMPLFKRMHEMTWDHVHEEIQLLAVDFSTMLFETSTHVPTYRDYYMRHDQRPHYQYLKTMLKALTFLRGGERWLLKSPQHLEQFPTLLETFPDATFVVTHRDPVSVTISMVTMLAYSSRMSATHPDPIRIGGEWSERLEVMLRSCAEHRDELPSAQTIDVPFPEFMADDIAMVRRIYETAGRTFTDATHQQMRSFMDAHPRGRHGSVVYDFAAVGIDPSERYAALDFYLRRFGLTPE